jgi:hypothetical protein
MESNGLEVTIRQYPELLPEAGVGIVSVLAAMGSDGGSI